MFVVGVTGGIGSGKTTVTDMFNNLGIDIIDADLIAREVVQPGSVCLAEIGKHFGTDILLNNGELDRSALRKIIFSNDKERIWLEQLTHPAIRTEIKKQLKNASSPYTILSSPLLFETKQTELVDRILIVDVPEAIQRQRASTRDGAKENDIQSIIDKQISRENRLALADDVIDNSQSLDRTCSQVMARHKTYVAAAEKTSHWA